MSTENAEERERYESWLKGFRDIYRGAMDAYQDGYEKGLEQGKIVGRIRNCQQILKLPLTPREELLEMPLDELRARLAPLEQRLDALRS
jgi:flagellar biosynthesis/type III secretory pathway protein FliH